MNRLFERIRKNEQGLTLIELIVVVAIIGVLAWLITPRVLDALNTSKLNSAESAANEILSGMERYAAELNAYPTEAAAAASLDVLGVTLNIHSSSSSKYFASGVYEYDINAADTTQFCIILEATDNDSTPIFVTDTGVLLDPAVAAIPAHCDTANAD